MSSADAEFEFDVDVVIVGAGFTGLTVAEGLHRSGLSFVLLDARDRVGGKVESMVDGSGRRVDTGGQFANDDMTALLALAQEAGARRVDSPTAGRAVTVPATQGDPWAAGEALVDRIGGGQLDDDRSVLAWAGAHTESSDVVAAVRSMVNGSTCHDSAAVPVSYLAQLAARTPMHHEELQCWFADTLHSVAEHLAVPFAEHLRLGHAATSIDTVDGGVVVRAGESSWHTRHVVVAAPPSAYASIRFEPPLPAEVRRAAAAFVPGTVIKYLIGYPHAFWLSQGRNGIAQFIEPVGLYFADASLADAPTLVGFLGGPTAVEWMSRTADERRDAVLHHAAAAFGPEALRPLSFLERVWAPDPWGGGGYCNVHVVHSPTAVDTLSAGVPGITFASTELAAGFPGYVEGAIRAGRAAAERVCRELRVR